MDPTVCPTTTATTTTTTTTGLLDAVFENFGTSQMYRFKNEEIYIEELK